MSMSMLKSMDSTTSSYLNFKLGENLDWKVLNLGSTTLFMTEEESTEIQLARQELIKSKFPGMNLSFYSGASSGKDRLVMNKQELLNKTNFLAITTRVGLTPDAEVKPKAAIETTIERSDKKEATPALTELSKQITLLEESLFVTREIWLGSRYIAFKVHYGGEEARKKIMASANPHQQISFLFGKKEILNANRSRIIGKKGPELNKEILAYYELCKKETLLSFNKEAAKKELLSLTIFHPTLKEEALQNKDAGFYWIKPTENPVVFEFCVVDDVSVFPKKNELRTFSIELTDTGFRYKDQYFPTLHKDFLYEVVSVEINTPAVALSLISKGTNM